MVRLLLACQVINNWERDFKGLFISETSDLDDKYYKKCLRKNVI